MKNINIGLLGYGTVGTGVARLLIENRSLISSRVNADLNLKKIADIDIETDRGLKLEKGILTNNAEEIINDSEIDIIIEMIGGETVAKELILKAIKNKKHIVTANKSLLATTANELFRAAAENGVDIAFEASVGGCIPIIKTIRESLVCDRIDSMIGILNGTCNYILSKITNEKTSFEDALGQAKKNGFAEADPYLDIKGIDTAHKTAILTALAHGIHINYDNIYVEGISSITPMDIEFAEQFGYRIKLLSIIKNLGNAVEARVHPTMLPINNIISKVNGSLNAVAISGDAIGNMLLCGHGAGMMPTANAVMSDVVDISRNIIFKTVGRIPLLPYDSDKTKDLPILPIEKISTHYYFRFSAIDRPKVLSKISGVLGYHGISIKSVHQKGRREEQAVPVVMMTHTAKESEVKKALAEISSLDIVSGKPVVIRIEDKQM